MYDEEIDSKSGKELKRPMRNNMQSMEKLGTWTLLDLSKRQKDIQAKTCVLFEIGRARKCQQVLSSLSCRMFSKISGVDFLEVLSPVSKLTTVRRMIALSTEYVL